MGAKYFGCDQRAVMRSHASRRGVLPAGSRLRRARRTPATAPITVAASLAQAQFCYDVYFRADFVRSTPESRRGSGRSRESVVDPKATFVKLVTSHHDGAPSSNIRVAQQDRYVLSKTRLLRCRVLSGAGAGFDQRVLEGAPGGDLDRMLDHLIRKMDVNDVPSRRQGQFRCGASRLG